MVTCSVKTTNINTKYFLPSSAIDAFSLKVCHHFCLGITSFSKHVASINQMDLEYHVIFYIRYGCDIKYRAIHQFVLFSKL